MKKLITFSLSLSFVFLPLSASAQTAFGGFITSIYPCTCTGGTLVFYSPLYVSSSVPVSGALYYSPFESILYSFYNPITPGVWNLGKFIPGVQECLEATPAGCIPVPSLGSVFFEGTSGL